ncbi:uncharacterized protein [Dermacentor albipictus]|uniref:uncharacterized protein isoform X2 n=1 Tax=Dermacentor albipictus TaxID=60249 RepID=UPI0031FDBD69
MAEPLIAPLGAPVGGLPGPEDEMDPMQMEMMLQQAMYDLMQRPIIPDPLVFICAALYLIIMMMFLITGAIYFTSRLKPLPPPAPAEETETTVGFTVTEEIKPWAVPSPDSNPFICFVGLQYKDNTDMIAALEADCNFIVMKEDFDNSGGSLRLGGKAMNATAVLDVLQREYGSDLAKIGVGLQCCSIMYQDLQEQLFHGNGDFSGSCKFKLGLNTDIAATKDFIEANTYCSNILLEIAEANEGDITRLAPLLDLGDYILYAPTPMTAEALAQRRATLLPNNFQGLPGSRSKTAEDAEKAIVAAKKHKKVCVMFTVAAFNSSGVGSAGTGPDNQPATNVVAVNQFEVCPLTGLIFDRPSMSLYRKGGYMISQDNETTIAKKVKTVLKKHVDVCIAAYDVQFDTCKGVKERPLTHTIGAVFKKNLRRQ